MNVFGYEVSTISEIIAYKGDIYRRTDMHFYVRHDDGSTLWQQREPGRYGEFARLLITLS